MKKLLLILGFLLLFPINVKAVDVSATSIILMDIDSRKVLYEKDIHNKRSVASISKVMTAILAIESGKLDEVVVIGEEIEEAYGSGIYIKQGEEMTLRDLVYGLLLRSGNDAAYSIAKFVGGSVDNFVKMMNDKAIELGMLETTFNNPCGLDEQGGNLSTAYDMALLTSYNMQNEIYREITKTKKHTVKTNMNYYSWTNKHKLLFSYKYATGGKTGYTDIARRTLITTASRDNLNLVVVSLNDGDDFSDHKELFEYGFNNYKNYKILESGLIDIPGETYYKDYNLKLNTDYYYPLMENEKNSVIVKFELEKKRVFNDNDVVGKAYVYTGDKKIYETDILLSVKEKEHVSFLKKIKDWFEKLW